MKKGFKSLLSLILVFVSALVIVGCKKTTVVDDTNEVLGKAASYVFGLYKDTVGTKTDSFEVLNAVKIGDKKVTLTWALTVTDENNNAIENSEAVTLTKKNEAESTVYVGFYDGKVTSKILFTLAPSLTYKETTKTLVELEGEDGATKGVFKYSVDPMVLGNRTAWDALANDKTTSINLKGVVLGVLQDGSSKGSFYFQDADGYGYYAYNPTNAVTSAGKFNVKTGDVVIVSGKRSDFNGQQEFAKGCTFKVLSSNGQPTVLDASADWAAAKSNTGLDAKYQNNYVKLENCKAVAIPAEGATEFLFTVGNGTTQFNIYDSYYFLSTEQRDAFKAAWAAAYNDGATFTIEGVSTYYNKYQIYGATFKPEIITVTGSMTDEEKCQGVIDEVSQAIPAYLLESKDITLPTTGRFNGVTVTWALKTENANVKIENGVLKITKNDALTSVVVEATATKGEASKKQELTITMVNETISVSQFLAAADKTNVQYVEGIVAAIKGTATTAGSFVLVGTDGKAVFSYNSLLLHVGEKVVIAAKYATNGAINFPQMGSISVVAVLATEQQVPGTATEFTRTEVAEIAADATSLAAWTGKLLKTAGYAVKTSDKTKWEFYADAEKKNLITTSYAGTELGIEDGKYYEITGYARGLGAGFITLQVASATESKAPITVEPKDLTVDATQPVVLKAASGSLTVAENKIAKSETVNIVFYTDKACETAANLSGKYVQIEGIAVKGTDSTISFYVTNAKKEQTAQHAGTEADPYSIADAKLIGAELSKSDYDDNGGQGDVVLGYFKGYVVNQGTINGTAIKNVTLGDTADATSTLIVFSVNTTETLKNAGTGDLVVVYGYLMNWRGTVEISSAKNDQNQTVAPVLSAIVSRAKGTISVDSTSSDKATVNLPAQTSVDNGSEVEFTVTAASGYEVVTVKVDDVEVTAVEGKYKAIVRGNTVVVVSTKVEGAATAKVLAFTQANMTQTFSGYTGTVKGTSDSIEWEAVNFNSNGTSWNFIKAGRKSGNDSIATIKTQTVPGFNVGSIVISLDSGSKLAQIQNTNNSFKLSVYSDKACSTKVGEDIAFTITAVGDVTINIPAAQQGNYFYVLTFDLKAGSDNGYLVVKSITLNPAE